MKKQLTVALGLALLSTPAFACNRLDELVKETKSHYSNLVAPLYNEKNQIIGEVKPQNVMVSEYLLMAREESFLLVSFDIRMRERVYHLASVVSVDPATCTIETFNKNDTFGSSMK